jgi:hypothetical protein
MTLEKSLRDSQGSKMSLLDRPLSQLIKSITNNPNKYQIQDYELDTSSERSRLNYNPEPQPKKFSTPNTQNTYSIMHEKRSSNNPTVKARSTKHSRINNISSITTKTNNWSKINNQKLNTSDFCLVHKLQNN